MISRSKAIIRKQKNPPLSGLVFPANLEVVPQFYGNAVRVKAGFGQTVVTKSQSDVTFMAGSAQAQLLAVLGRRCTVGHELLTAQDSGRCGAGMGSVDDPLLKRHQLFG